MTNRSFPLITKINFADFDFPRDSVAITQHIIEQNRALFKWQFRHAAGMKLREDSLNWSLSHYVVSMYIHLSW